MNCPDVLRWLMMVLLCGPLLVACNLGDDETSTNNDGESQECVSDQDCDGDVCLDGDCVACSEDADCSEGVCANAHCVECVDNEHCVGTDVCVSFQCVSGCEVLDCGVGGNCVEDDGEPVCACDEGYTLDGDECVEDDTETCPDVFCDEFDLESKQGIFVSRHGDDADPGTHSRPVRTIQRGVELAAELDGDDREVYIGDGEYEESVVVFGGVSLYGRYHHSDSETWERGEEYETLLLGGEEDRFRPLRVEGNGESLEIGHLRIETGDVQFDEEGTDGAARPGEEVAAVVLADNSADVVLNYVEVEAGTGGDGMVMYGNSGEILVQNSVIVAGDGGVDYGYVDGMLSEVAGTSVGILAFDNSEEIEVVNSQIVTGEGARGADGEPGEAGEDGADGEDAENSGWNDLGWPGTRVTQSCSFGADPLPSGAGGQGGDSSTNLDGEPGEDAVGVGGEGGRPCAGGGDVAATEGRDAQVMSIPGFPGAAGFPVAGRAALDIVGSGHLIYRGMTGNRGEAGGAGHSAGGGGGSGGGGSSGNSCSVLRAGGSGGSGGTGGCGGEGGGGGQWGGGSIAVIAYGSSLMLRDSTIETSAGGRGGDGAPGGAGGDGGEGGEGGDDTDGDAPGGDGGRGSQGGEGGAGAGGEGGPSIGILHQASQVHIEDVEFDLASAGAGGTGGANGNDGPFGIRSQLLSVD